MSRLGIACVSAHVLVLGLWMSAAPAADTVINRFESADEVAAWVRHWGGAQNFTASFDPDKDAGGGASPGALKIEVDYDRAITCDNDCNNIAFGRALDSAMDFSGFGTLEFDFWVDPSSPRREPPDTPNPNADHGYFGVATRDGGGWTTNFSGGRGLNPEGQWVHVSIAINAFPNPPHNDVRALTFQNWGGDAGTELHGHMILWLDNLVLTPLPGGPASTLVINNFDAADEVAAWWYDQPQDPYPIPTVTWDPTVDANNDSNSGSMKVVIPFDNGLYGSYNTNQILINRNWPGAPFDAREYDRFTARVKVDPASARDPANNHGWSQWVFRNNWGWNPAIGADLRSSGSFVDANGWHNYDAIITNPNDPARDALMALTYQIWGGGWQNLTGTTTIWIDYISISRSRPCTDPNNCEICNNLEDDNGDGLIDCHDPDCRGGPLCPPEAICDNHVDDNLDGLTDCADPTCAESANCKANDPFADVDGDGDVDAIDFGKFQACITGPVTLTASGCGMLDRDHDEHIVASDLNAFLACVSGPNIPADKSCDGGE
ncbi:MAG: hypothetical protein HRF43_02670 [Phycisphaerae bacterium]